MARQLTIRGIYAIDDPHEADSFVTELTGDLLDTDHPPEVRSLGRTLHRWHDQIVAWHRSRVSNGPTEAANNLIKRIKRVGFGFRRFAHYRLRVLLYAGRPNWGPHRHHRPRSNPMSPFGSLLSPGVRHPNWPHYRYGE